ncbi:MAG: HEPN domain-containing protein [Acidobacteria bacterium]|nr:HEPN domain-containing protein [Acidobacteriota bacterium]
MAVVERSGDWMNQARGDLDHARHASEDGFYDWACFSCQQAAEKAVKAVFQSMGQEGWGHSVADLLRELDRSRSVPQDLIRGALELDKAYIPTRYPNAHPSGAPRDLYTEDEASRLFQHAQRIVEWCQNLLSAV